jgi:hypothetical protein
MSSSTRAQASTAQAPPFTVQAPARHELYAIAVVGSSTPHRPDTKLIGAYYKERDAKMSLETYKETLIFGRTNSGNGDDRVEVRETMHGTTGEVISQAKSDIPVTTKFERLAHRVSLNRRFIPEMSTHLVVLTTEERAFASFSDRPLSELLDFPSWHFEARDANQEAFLMAMELADRPDMRGWYNIKARYVGEQVEFCVERSTSNAGGSFPYVWILVIKANSQSNAWGADVLSSDLSQEEKARTLCQRALGTA